MTNQPSAEARDELMTILGLIMYRGSVPHDKYDDPKFLLAELHECVAQARKALALIPVFAAQAVAASRQPLLSDDEFQALIKPIWLKVKPSHRAQSIRSALSVEFDSPKTPNWAADECPEYVWDLVDIAAQRGIDTASERAKPGAGDVALLEQCGYIMCDEPCDETHPDCDCKLEKRRAVRLAAEARRAGESAMREVEMEADQAIQFAIGWIGGLPTSLPASFEDKFAAQKALNDTLGRIRALTTEPDGRS